MASPVATTYSRTNSVRDFNAFFKRLQAPDVGEIKSCELSIHYLRKIGSTFMKMSIISPPKLTLPENDQALLEYLREYIKQPVGSQAFQLAPKAIEILAQPLPPSVMKPSLDFLRQQAATYNADLFKHMEDSIRETLEHIHTTLAERESIERIISKEIIILASSTDNPQNTLRLSYLDELDRICGHCKKIGTLAQPLLVCSGCLIAHYCNRTCQSADRKIHRISCLKTD